MNDEEKRGDLLIKIKNFYSNLRIKYKMFLLISIVLFAFSIGGIIILQYGFKVYNQEIYRQSAQALRVSSNTIETEFRKIERLSYQVATDQFIQNYLYNIKYSTNDFEIFLIGNELKKRLVQIGALDKYISSVQVYDIHGVEHSVGSQTLVYSENRINEITRKVQSKQGKIEWILPDHNDESLIIAREARYYKNFSMENLGQIVVRFDVEKVVSDVIGNIDNEGTEFLIYTKNNDLVYALDGNFPHEYFVDITDRDKTYELIEVGGKQYFVTYSPSGNSKWMYLLISPYSSLFQAISSAKTAVIITYAILFILVMFIGMRFINNIIRPIESLNRKMKRVQKSGIDRYDDEETDFDFANDESKEMHDNFTTMMNQINELISENYKRQIAIKDAEFKALQAQINPHFLYNTLDSINWSAKIDGHTKISEIVESLGYLMRKSIGTKESLITIENELRIVKNYIRIQSYRFEERLDFRVDIPEKIMEAKVPKFALQLLIENSIHYGLQQMVGVCKIRVKGIIVADQIILSVQDNGPGIEKQHLKKLQTETYESKGTGIGLKNIKERLEVLFGESYGVNISSNLGEGTLVSITIPYKEEK